MKKPLGQLLDSLPLEERIKAYRELALDAFRKAAQATDQELRASRLAEATAWHSLALEVEKTADLSFFDASGPELDRPRPSKN